MASLSFPSPTQLKNLSDPSANNDAATKYYVDTQLSSGASVGASGSNTQVQFNTANVLSASANFTFDSATSLLNVVGNISANYFIGNGSQLTGVSATTATTATTALKLANGTSNVNIASSDGNITVSVGGTANTIVFANTGNYITTTGNLSASYLFGNGSQLTGIISSYGNSNVATYLPTYTGDLGGGNLTLSGNLIVGGTTSRVNSTITTIVDPIFELGGGANGAILSTDDNKDRGLLLHYYSGSSAVDAFIGWDDSNVEFVLASNVSVTNEVVTYNQFGNLRLENIFANNANFGGVVFANGNISTNGSFTGNLVGNVTGSVTGSVTVSGGAGAIQFANATNVLSSSANLNFNSTTNTLSANNISASNISLTGANVSLGNVSNLHIDGGTSGYFLTTDGSGGLSWAAQTALTATVDEFTANGTYTTFTLSTTPSSENVTMVAVQGILQPKSSYSLMGPQLTFDAPPPESAFIEVTTFSGGGGGAGGGGGGEALSALYRAYTGNGVANTFTVTSGVTANSVLVAENGILQRPTTDYTIAGTTLTFVTAPANGVDIQIRELSSGGASGTSSALTWNIASSNATMSSNNGYFVDTSTAAKTMTLPISATLGDTIRINDLAGSFSTNNLTVARNGHKIQGVAQDLLVDVDQSSFGLVYSNSTYGWKVLEL